MTRLICKLALAAAAAVVPLGGAMAADTSAVKLEPGTHADSPLKLTEIWSRNAFGPPMISPDGKYFAATSAISNNRAALHIIDRKTMQVVHSESFNGEISVGSVEWFDNDNLLINPTVKSELSEGRGGFGVFMLNVKTKAMRLVWDGSGSSDYGGSEGGSLAGKIDKEHYWFTLSPSGSTYSEFPYVYLYKLNIMTGQADRVMKSPSRGSSFVFNEKNEVTHAVGMLPDSFDDVVVHKRVGDKWVLESQFRKKDGGCTPQRWHKADPNKILYICDDQIPTGGAYWIDARTGKRELIYSNPKVEVDKIDFNADDEAYAVHYQYDYPVYEALKPDSYEVRERTRLVSAFPKKYVSIESQTDDGIEKVVRVFDERGVGKYYLYNKMDGTIRFLLDPKPKVEADKYPSMYAVHFKARDGMDIVGYLTVPKQAKSIKNLPLIIHPHGGPHGPRDSWGYNPEVAAFANAGYAVLQVNYRGSGGYGRKFQFDWYRHWGLEMQEDLEDATQWAIKSGVADANRICIYGASYGGYAALMGVVKTPDLYKCSIGYVGVYDLNTFSHYGDVSRTKAGRRYLAEALGTDPAEMATRSPTPNANRIKVPIFLVEGMQDDRVFPKHYLDMKEALKKGGHPFETLEIQRAGHGAQDRASVREISCRMIDFFDRYIGPKKPADTPDDCKFEDDKDLKFEYYGG